jgi:hydrogenase expression/formation protein HypD
MVIGNSSYRFIANIGQVLVIAGCAADILHGIWMVLKQIDDRRWRSKPIQARGAEGGNTVALDAIGEVFELREFFEWRGLGSIDHSEFAFANLRRVDAERRFSVPALKIADPKSCQCGAAKGVIKPRDCKVFGRDCTPETPLGALMVSSEGACAAYYQYGDIEKIHDTRHWSRGRYEHERCSVAAKTAR